jgi:hypothetical protein
MFWGVMDLAPLLYVIRVMERSLLLLIWGLLLTVFVVSAVFAIVVIFLISHVDFSVVLLLLHGPLATRLKKSSPSFGSLDACVSHREQIGHHLGLFHGDLLHGLDVADSVVEGINDLDVLDIRDSVLDIVEMFHVVS